MGVGVGTGVVGKKNSKSKLQIICKTLKKEGRAFRNIGQKIIYSRL